MKSLLLLTLIVLFSSCTPMDGDSKSAGGSVKDSAIIYYKRSLDSTLSLTEKKQSINKSFFLAKDNQDSLYGKILYQKSYLSLALGEYDSLPAYNKLIIGNARQINDVPMMAKQHYFMGYYYDSFTSKPDSAFNHYNYSKNYFLQLNDSVWVGKALFNMGTIQKDQNDFFGSKETLTEAWPYLENSGESNLLAKCYNLLATNHRKLFNYADAIKYYQMAINLSGLVDERISFENNLGATYTDFEKYEEAIDLFERIIKDSSLDHSTAKYARILDNLSYANWLSGKEDSAEPFMEALNIRIRDKDERGQIASYTHLGEFYMEKYPRLAKAYFDSVIDISKHMKIPRAESDALRFLMQMEPEKVKLRDRYIFLKDSLYEEELDVKTQFAKYKYDDKLKQESILRLEKENAEQALIASEERSKKAMSYFGLLILLSGLSFVVYFYKQRTKRLKEQNKTAKLVATLETEAEMSRRLHDDFGAGLNQTMLMLQGDADKTKIMDRLDGLYNQSRNFSREVNEVDTGTPFKEEFLEMLRYRTPSRANLIITGTKDIEWNGVPSLSKKVLYKVMQELMINMGKHSKATLITIGFKKTGSELLVKYNDNGVGASPKDLNAKNGLRNTEKRIQAIGGSITFDSGKGEGFSAHVVIPI
ncbi:tetratricopeptide repeat-containing sensor histidine kinase [Flagellimonas profundi]|uniref:histidine kinase n=1 Tax=Flagellimonas profundi TaxID=2915620 RepID=A0ABS3FIQ0_9FLAO|nr:tetratricopeptide repeat-containing sensor histidine kinase [Allomuricauda profundi]MBO0343011.1 tetratricopeptide repeat protein [Allomuricauda profundi]